MVDLAGTAPASADCYLALVTDNRHNIVSQHLIVKSFLTNKYVTAALRTLAAAGYWITHATLSSAIHEYSAGTLGQGSRVHLMNRP